MELTDLTRSQIVATIRDAIDASGGPGKFEFYTSAGVLIVSLQLAYPCMTIVNGVGTFNDVSPYLRGTVQPGFGGIANRWTFKDKNDVVIMTGTCGDPSNTGRDIQFNDLNWSDWDNVSITGLTLTIPTGSNNYIP